MDAVATSAIRDAANRDELLAAIRERTGLEVRVISGAEEAWYGYLAIANSHDARATASASTSAAAACS